MKGSGLMEKNRDWVYFILRIMQRNLDVKLSSKTINMKDYTESMIRVKIMKKDDFAMAKNMEKHSFMRMEK